MVSTGPKISSTMDLKCGLAVSMTVGLEIAHAVVGAAASHNSASVADLAKSMYDLTLSICGR